MLMDARLRLQSGAVPGSRLKAGKGKAKMMSRTEAEAAAAAAAAPVELYGPAT